VHARLPALLLCSTLLAGGAAFATLLAAPGEKPAPAAAAQPAPPAPAAKPAPPSEASQASPRAQTPPSAGARPAGATPAGARPAGRAPAAQAGAKPAEPAAKTPWSAQTWSGLRFRSIGPAVTSGRVADIAVDPTKPSRWYVAAASGGVWKTENAGTSWTPIFDNEGAYSIGCVTLDPSRPLTVWVGTGENKSQRSVGYGDGVYRSDDGGKSWRNMGLRDSEHIGKILVHPKNSDIVFVAAQGPLWSAGGDRGLYKTTDGGRTWKAVLTVSEHTGATDVVMDPRNPDVLLAATHQRRRHVWTLINGGPESAIYKSTDGGETWRKITRGLPAADMGRIGLAISPANPDIVYATIEAANDQQGMYRSTDGGETWEKRSSYVAQGMYYGEIFADPKNPDRLYAVDVFNQVSEDGGATWRRLGEANKHVDNHVIWIDPTDTDHLVVGCDGGVYETWDRGAAWEFKANLPIAQFYRVDVDDSWPVYYVYGGTQDNSSLGVPSRTLDRNGIKNADWFFTWGGDGFQSRVEPGNPNIVYATLQYGVLARFDRKSGESLLIQPQEEAGEPPLRWNWDSPLLISPHAPTRIYIAANRVFRSDDRGSTWKPVSPDLTRQIDRNALPVMGKVWGPDAVAKNQSTSFYGNIVSFDESPLVEGLLYAGTDDGLIQVSEDGGGTWRRQEKFPGIPDMTYVSDLLASRHDANVVYAAFNNHKMGDFKPYLLRSADRGRTWTSIAGDLPARGSTWTIAEDPVDRDLLFCGTEFGLFFTKDGGRSWVRLQGGLPTIAVRDIAIQARENDLVIATFGRGIYILDDYTPLRVARPADLEQPALTFPVKKVLGYMPSSPLGGPGKASLGESFYVAPNPPFGAVFTYYLKESAQTRRERRQAAEKEAERKGETIRYPTREELVAEAREEAPTAVLTVTDSGGSVVRRITGPARAGIHRVAWNLRYPASTPVSLRQEADSPFAEPPSGPMVMPGTYTVSFALRVDGKETPFGTPQTFEVAALNLSTLPEADRKELLAFEQKVARLQRAVLGAINLARETADRLEHLKRAVDETPGAAPSLAAEVRALDGRLKDIQVALSGDQVMARRNEPTPPSIQERVNAIVRSHWTTTSPPTGTNQRAYEIAADEFTTALEQLRQLVEVDLKKVEAGLEAAGGPWTPGRVPVWKKER
jgi:photosystem II stability/assembly factor-like uncharacterized protein